MQLCSVSIQKNDSVFIKTICSFKSVQVHARIMEQIRFMTTMLNPSRLIRLIGLLLVGNHFYELDSIVIDALFDFKFVKRIGQTRL
jgi:hypothetical protein